MGLNPEMDCDSVGGVRGGPGRASERPWLGRAANGCAVPPEKADKGRFPTSAVRTGGYRCTRRDVWFYSGNG